MLSAATGSKIGNRFSSVSLDLMPTLFAAAVAIVCLAVGVLIVALNWTCAYLSLRNRAHGIDKHHSTSPLVAQLVLLVGFAIGSRFAPDVSPGWVFLGVALADISLWQIIYLPIFLLFRRSEE